MVLMLDGTGDCAERGSAHDECESRFHSSLYSLWRFLVPLRFLGYGLANGSILSRMESASMLTCLVALISLHQSQSTAGSIQPRLDADVTASLVRDDLGNWTVNLVGPASPANWAADPDQLQLSLMPVGDEPG